MSTVKQVIAVRTDLKMGKGKLAAQAAHASLEAYKKTRVESQETAREWEETGCEKVVVKVENEQQLLEVFQKARAAGIPAALIRDAGRTQVEPGTLTCAGLGPWREEEIDRITKHLKLL